MSIGNPEAFPWGSNTPTKLQRAAFAFSVGALGVLILLQKFARLPNSATDFDLVWFGARLLRDGNDPYLLVGPHNFFYWDFPFLYPLPSLLVALPFSFLGVRTAALAFVFAGSSLLGYGATKDGWHLLPMFASSAFIDCALTAQWSPLLVAGFFIPWIGALCFAKPQLGLAVVSGSQSRAALFAAAVGTLALLTISFAILPNWFSEWAKVLGTADHMKAALFQPLGFLIPVVLVRWRRAESWAVIVVAILPQTLMWYSVLILLALPKTYREACVLSLLSSGGYFLVHLIAENRPPVQPTGDILWAVVVCTTFLPTVAAILRRPNRDSIPAWMTLLSKNTWAKVR